MQYELLAGASSILMHHLLCLASAPASARRGQLQDLSTAVTELARNVNNSSPQAAALMPQVRSAASQNFGDDMCR